MNTKRFLLLAFINLSLTTGIHAAEDTTIAQADEITLEIVTSENNLRAYPKIK